MNKIRRGPQVADNFTMLPNSQIRDDTLTWEARGLLAWLHSHREGFEVTEAAMIEAGSFGRDGVRRMVRELEDAGYLTRERTYDVAGGSTVDYVLTYPRTTAGASPGDDGRAVVRAEQGKQAPKKASSQASPDDGQGVGRSSSEDQKKTNTKTSSSLRATRVPDDFMPDEELRAWFVEEKLPAVIDGKREHEKFMDYWLGCPGVRGRKLDWRRTWRNWMREAADRASRNGVRQPGNSLVPTSGAPMNYKPSTTDQRIAQGQALAAKYREQGL
jgi:hypothetical protein